MLLLTEKQGIVGEKEESKHMELDKQRTKKLMTWLLICDKSPSVNIFINNLRGAQGTTGSGMRVLLLRRHDQKRAVAFVPQPVVFPFQLFVSAEICCNKTINIMSLGTSCEMFTLHPGPGGMSRESDRAHEIWSFPSQSNRSQEIVLYWSVVSCFCVWGHRHEERKGIVFPQVSYVKEKRKNHKSILAKRSLRDFIFHSVQIYYVPYTIANSPPPHTQTHNSMHMVYNNRRKTHPTIGMKRINSEIAIMLFQEFQHLTW